MHAFTLIETFNGRLLMSGQDLKASIETILEYIRSRNANTVTVIFMSDIFSKCFRTLLVVDGKVNKKVSHFRHL